MNPLPFKKVLLNLTNVSFLYKNGFNPHIIKSRAKLGMYKIALNNTRFGVCDMDYFHDGFKRGADFFAYVYQPFDAGSNSNFLPVYAGMPIVQHWKNLCRCHRF